MSSLNEVKGAWLYLILINSLLFAIFVPLYLIGVSPLDYAFLDFSTLLKVSIVSGLGILLFLCVLYQILRIFGFPKLGNATLHFTLFWGVGAGLLFPVAASTGMTDANEIGTNYLNLFATIGFALGMTLLVQKRIRQFVYIFVFVMTIVSVGGKISSVYQVYFSLDKSGFTTLSKKKNILVFCFDGIPGSMAKQILEQNPELKSKFEDFNIYNNVVATSPATLASLMGELFSNIDLKGIAPTEKGLLEKLDKSSLLMNHPGLDVYTYGEYNHFNQDPSTRVAYGGLRDFTSDSDKVEDVMLFYSYVAVRLGTGLFVDIYEKIQPILKRIVTALSSTDIDVQNESLLLSEQLKDHKGFDWDKRNIASLSDLNKILRDLEIGTNETVVRYMHFTFTHFPVDFDREGNYRSHEDGWFAKNQNENSVWAETTWAMTKVGDVVDKLKEVGAYENTLLVLKSDHGKPGRYFTKGIDALKINNHNDWGFIRYRPMLMLKDIGQNRSEPLYVNDLVLLDDLAITLSNRATDSFEASDLVGVDLLSFELFGDSEFFMYVPSDENSDWRIDTHQQITVSREGDFLESLLNHSEISVSDN